MNASKQTYINQVRQLAVILANVKHQAVDLDDVWNSRFYGPGGASEFNDAELQDLGITADALYAFVILCNQLRKFFNNEIPTQGNYSATINKLRTDY